MCWYIFLTNWEGRWGWPAALLGFLSCSTLALIFPEWAWPHRHRCCNGLSAFFWTRIGSCWEAQRTTSSWSTRSRRQYRWWWWQLSFRICLWLLETRYSELFSSKSCRWGCWWAWDFCRLGGSPCFLCVCRTPEEHSKIDCWCPQCRCLLRCKFTRKERVPSSRSKGLRHDWWST